MTIELRTATTSDAVLLERALYAAWQWRHRWDEAAFQDHLRSSSSDSYVDGFGRWAGDAGLIAEETLSSTTAFVGAAWYRLFEHPSRRAGFVAEDIPELVVAVEADHRGHGLGRRLLAALLDVAQGQGHRAVSLHVSNENTAASGLYESMGFHRVGDHEWRGAVMLRQLRL